MTGYQFSDRRNRMSFPGKIAIVTSHVSEIEEDYRSAKSVISKYGAEKVVHITWPPCFFQSKREPDELIAVLAPLAVDREIRAIIINQSPLGTNVAVNKLKETRDDIYFVCCTIHDPPPEVASCANLILMPNDLGIGTAIVKQAKKQGAKAFVHYSFPRHMTQPLLSARRDLIRETCEAEGIRFIDATSLDPAGEADIVGIHKFIYEDVPKMTAMYGEDTAFFSTNCHTQEALIRAVVDNHAIYPQGCCPSPFHGFPKALGIEVDEDSPDLNHVINEACRIAGEKNMTDRLSTWPVPAPTIFTYAGAEYAIKCLKGEAPHAIINARLLADCISVYIEELVGEDISIYLTSYSEDGKTYDNAKQLLMGYLDF